VQTPTDQISALNEYFCLFNNSGAIFKGVPIWDNIKLSFYFFIYYLIICYYNFLGGEFYYNTLAKPKSHTLIIGFYF